MLSEGIAASPEPVAVDGEVRFDAEEADRVEAFFARRLRHTKGRWMGSPFVLDDWQRDDIIRPLFGWQRWSPEMGRWVRLYRKAYLELPKKEGKSEMGAGIALQGVYADGEANPEVFSIAADKKQAGLVFNVAADMVQMDAGLAGRSKVARSKIQHHGVIETSSRLGPGLYMVLPGDAATNDGINPSRVVLDELHRQPGRELYDLMDESFGARDQPLFVILSTAGYEDPTHVWWEVREYAEQVASGVIRDPYFFCYMRYLKPDTARRWDDEATWRLVNPSLGGFNAAKIDEMRRLAAEARESPAKRASFLRYRLNVALPRGATSADKLIDLAVWDRSGGLLNRDGWTSERPLFGGLDTAAVNDLAALVGVFPNDAGSCRQPQCCDADEWCVDVTASFWVPEHQLTAEAHGWSRAVRAQLAQWVDDGWIHATPGDVIDDRAILGEVDQWKRRWRLVEVAKDPWQSKQLGVELMDAGVTVWDHRQTMAELSDPTSLLIRMVRAGRVHHGGHPVLRWMAESAVGQTDTDGRIKPSKRRSSGKIDGIVALIMALSAATRLRPGAPAVFNLADYLSEDAG